MKHFFALTFLAISLAAQAQQVFSCAQSGWSADGPCGVQAYGYGYSFNGNTGTTIVNGNVQLITSGHQASSLIWIGAPVNPQVVTPVNVQAFTSTFTFVPDGLNIAFTLNNSNNVPGIGGPNFVAGAGCESGFYQAYTSPEPNNVFALELDSNSPLTAGASFTYSSAMIYQSNQSPCQPPVNSDPAPTKISTYPVALNSPATTPNTTTGHTYSATVSYDGSNLTLALFDVTANGSCPGSSCFTHTWPNVNIPSIVSGNTAYVGLTGGSNSNNIGPLTVYSFSYATGSAPPPPPVTVATPTFSPAAGTYTSAQTVTLSDSTGGTSIYYSTNGSFPSTLYTGPLIVGTSETIQAIANRSGYIQSAAATAAYVINLPAPPTTQNLSIPAQTIPLTIITGGSSINATVTVPAQTVTVPQ